VQVDLKGLSELISAVCIWDDFDDSTEQLVFSCSVANDLVRGNIQVQVAFREDLLEEFDELESQDILT